MRVAAISLNRGEVSVAGGAPADLRFGEDFAGAVERAEADGIGPQRKRSVEQPLQVACARLRNASCAHPLGKQCYTDRPFGCGRRATAH